MTHTTPEPPDEVLTTIARNYAGIETLNEQGRDSLDFHELSVHAIREMLAAAYRAGGAER